MPNFLAPGDQDVPIGDTSLAALLAGTELPGGSPPELRPLAEALAELRGRPASDELAGEAATLTAFRNQFGSAGAPRRAGARKPASWLRPRLARAAAIVAAAALGLGGIATAAYAGKLPTGLQRLAHDVIGAPVPGARPVAKASAAGTAGPPRGLCVAWAHAKAQGTRKQQAVAFGRLAAAAGGPGNVTAFCAAAAGPGISSSPAPHPVPTPLGPGKPTALPTPGDSGKPTGLPTPGDSGKPTGLPTPRGSARPTGLPTPRNSAH